MARRPTKPAACLPLLGIKPFNLDRVRLDRLVT
jgi:hypothetical protein